MAEQKKVVVNKLFLIGNGFDLALGLKTSYNDFMFWLLKKYLLKSIENFGRQNAPAGYNQVYNGHKQRRVVYGYSQNDLFDILISENYVEIEYKIRSLGSLKSTLELISQYYIEIHPTFKKGLFDVIYRDCYLGWVDIESKYFDIVKFIINNNNQSNDTINNINADLENLIKELEEYLKEIELEIPENEASLYFKQFGEPVKTAEVFFDDAHQVDPEDGHLYFLNFNYTESLQYILTGCGMEFKDYTINHIHGSFHEESPIVFGFGDEMDTDYKKIEELNDNRFFKYIKSFKYFSNNNYRNLLRFLNSGYYQVCIYGHSCGLSDRVMLNEVFEHENCKSIKIYFYEDESGYNDFTTKAMDISRHFNSNKLMREKIVEFDSGNKIPQVKR